MLNHLRVMLAGESYWRVRLFSGKQLSELDTRPVEVRGKQVFMRRLEWLEDLIGAAGDIANVEQVMLCTPKGTAHLDVVEAYTVFQFSRGTMALDPANGRTVRLKNAQVIGVVTDKETGACQYACWDVQEQQLYTGENNVRDFKAWRSGIIPVGALNLEAMDVRLA